MFFSGVYFRLSDSDSQGMYAIVADGVLLPDLGEMILVQRPRIFSNIPWNRVKKYQLSLRGEPEAGRYDTEEIPKAYDLEREEAACPSEKPPTKFPTCSEDNDKYAAEFAKDLESCQSWFEPGHEVNW